MPVTIEHHVAFILNELAVIISLPERSKRVPIVIHIMLPNEILQVPCRSLRVPKGDPGEEVMDNMIVCNVVQEETPLPAQEGPVDSAGCAALEGPCSLSVMRKSFVRVMEIGYHNEPMGDAKPWDTVIFHDLCRAPDGGSIRDGPRHSKQTEIRCEYTIALRGSEQDGVGIEVIRPLRIALLS